jgi:hypothetical protein
MKKQRVEPVIGAVMPAFWRHVIGPRKVSDETAGKLFVGMMQNQARFGIVRSLLGPRMATIVYSFSRTSGSRTWRRLPAQRL